MSTKCTIDHDGNTHIFYDCFEDEVVVVRQLNASVSLTLKQAAAIGRYAEAQITHLRTVAGMTDEDIERRVKYDVMERIDRAKNIPSSWMNLMGFMGYGAADDPMEKQVQSGLEYWKQARDDARESLAKLDSNGDATPEQGDSP